MQRIESERAKRRQGARTDLGDISLIPNEGNTLDAVAASLGISRDRWYKLKTIFERAKSGDAHRPRWKPSERSSSRKRMIDTSSFLGAILGCCGGAGRV